MKTSNQSAILMTTLLLALVQVQTLRAAPTAPTAQVDQLATDSSKVVKKISLSMRNPSAVADSAASVETLAGQDTNVAGDCVTATDAPTVAAAEEVVPDVAPNEEVVPNNPRAAQPIRLFFNLQWMAVGSNGQMATVETPVPRVNFMNSVGNYATSNGLTREQVLGKTDAELLEIFKTDSGLTGQAADDAARNALRVVRWSGLGSEQAILDAIGADMRTASFGQKVGLLATFLSAFRDNYDTARTDSDSPNSEGRVELKQMMDAINGNVRNGTGIDAGVCRDMHQAAVRLARAMGINDAFGVGFATIGGGHRTLVLTDPNNRGQTVQLNYGSVTTHNGVAGPSALSQNGTLPDVGIRFRLYNSEDRPAIILPSDKGGILNIVTGGTDRDLDPFYQTPAQINQAGIETPYGNFRVFHAQASAGNGEQVLGGAYNVRIDYNSIFYGEYGIAGFYSTRDAQGGTINQAGGYAQVSQGFNSVIMRTEDVRIGAYGEVQGRVMVASTGQEGREGRELTADFNISTRLGIGAEYQTGPVSHRTALEAWSFFDQADGLDASQGVAFRTPSLLLSHRLEAPLGAGVVGNANVGIGYRDLGTNQYWIYTGGVGIDSTRTGTRIDVGSTGAITNDTPIWLPGSERMGRFTFSQDILGDRLQMNVQGQQSFETLNNHQVTFGIGGRF
jgi:hypothetical protein